MLLPTSDDLYVALLLLNLRIRLLAIYFQNPYYFLLASWQLIVSFCFNVVSLSTLLETFLVSFLFTFKQIGGERFRYYFFKETDF